MAGAHPGPLVELDYWAERAAHLNSIHDQLMAEGAQRVVRVLEQAGSTYHEPLQRLLQASDKGMRMQGRNAEGTRHC